MKNVHTPQVHVTLVQIKVDNTKYGMYVSQISECKNDRDQRYKSKYIKKLLNVFIYSV